MSSPASPHALPSTVRLKTVALPVEHGGWGMLAEPLVMGLLLVPTWAGAAITVAALGAFLARHPLKLALSDWQRGTRSPRTVLATKVGTAYAVVALGGLAVAASRAPIFAFWPLLGAAPLGLLQLWYDVRRQGRQLLPQLLGGIALGAGASVIMLAGGWAVAPALAAWALLAAKAMASILYVRARLRLDRDQGASRVPALLAHAAALVSAVVLATRGWGPWLGVGAFAMLLARAAHGLSPWHRRVRPQLLGLAEMGYGLVAALLIAVGYLKRA